MEYLSLLQLWIMIYSKKKKREEQFPIKLSNFSAKTQLSTAISCWVASANTVNGPMRRAVGQNTQTDGWATIFSLFLPSLPKPSAVCPPPKTPSMVFRPLTRLPKVTNRSCWSLRAALLFSDASFIGREQRSLQCHPCKTASHLSYPTFKFNVMVLKTFHFSPKCLYSKYFKNHDICRVSKNQWIHINKAYICCLLFFLKPGCETQILTPTYVAEAPQMRSFFQKRWK